MHGANRRYIGTLAAVAAGILVVGSLLRPSEPRLAAPLPGPSQAELSRLTRVSQRRSVDELAEYFASVAADLQASVVSLPSLERSGIVWEPDLILTTRIEPRFPDAATVTTPTGDVGAVSAMTGPDLPLAALRISPAAGLQAPRRGPVRPPARGEWTIAAWWRDRQASFTPAHYFGTAPVRCGGQTVDEVLTNITWTRAMTGGGLFDLDSNLVAVVTRCDERYVAVVAEGIAELLRGAQSLEGRLLRRYGLRVGPLSVAEQDYFARHRGLLVREVWTGYRASAAGVAPGDVLVAINAVPLSDIDRLEPLAGEPARGSFTLTVERHGETLNIPLSATAAVEPEEGEPLDAVGFVWQAEAEGIVIDDIAPDSRAADAGIRSGDRLLRIDGVDVASSDDVRAILAADRATAAFLELQRGGRRLGVLLR